MEYSRNIISFFMGALASAIRLAIEDSWDSSVKWIVYEAQSVMAAVSELPSSFIN